MNRDNSAPISRLLELVGELDDATDAGDTTTVVRTLAQLHMEATTIINAASKVLTQLEMDADYRTSKFSDPERAKVELSRVIDRSREMRTAAQEAFIAIVGEAEE